MRETPRGDRMKARQMFLDAHKPLIAHVYGLPSDDLKFDDTITEVMHQDRFIGDVALDFLMTEKGIKRVLRFQKEYRDKLISALENPSGDYVRDWDSHMDYEAIIMDKVLDLKRLPAQALMQPSARSFYGQQEIFALMHQGYQLSKNEPNHEKSHWFSQFNNSWYFKSCATKHRLIDILQQHTSQWEIDFAKNNVVEQSSLDETYDLMRGLQAKIIKNSRMAKNTLEKFVNDNPQLSEYMQFVSASIEYNEELRLMRSKSVVSLIHGARKEGIEPYQVFLNVLADRKIRLQEMYGK